MDNSKMKPHPDPLRGNGTGKNIKRSQMHQPNFTNAAMQHSQPQVYNINKNDFRNIVQQLTGSPSYHQEPAPLPEHADTISFNSVKNYSTSQETSSSPDEPQSGASRDSDFTDINAFIGILRGNRR